MATMTTAEPTGAHAGIFPDSPEGRAALQQSANRMKELNRGKRVPHIPRSIRNESRETQCYIFNLGPMMQEGNGASYGRVMIPACKPDQEYSEAYVVPGMPFELYNKEGSSLDIQFHGEEDADQGEPGATGWDWACNAIGGYTDAKGQFQGKFLHPNNSLEKFGVGISRSWPPAKADVALAKAKMFRQYRRDVEEANEAHALGNFSKIKGDHHFRAAHALIAAGEFKQEDFKWMYGAVDNNVKTENCAFCGVPVKQGVPKCHNCHEIVNQEAYDAAQARTTKKA